MSKDTKAKFGIGFILIEIALAVTFVIYGLGLLGLRGTFFATSDIRTAIAHLLSNGTLRDITCIAVGIVLILCGVFIFLQIFGISLGKIDAVISLIALIIWIVVAVIVNIIGGIHLDSAAWYLSVAKDLMIIGGLLIIK